MQINSLSGRLSSPGLTRALAVFFLLNAFVLNGLIWLATPPPLKETVLTHTLSVLRGEGGDDSWGPSAAALDYVQSPHTTPLYTEVFFNRGVRFQYPPPALFALAWMRLFGADRVRTADEAYYGRWPAINDFAGWAFIMLMAAATAVLLENRLRRSGGLPEYDHRFALRVAIVGGLTLTFYPVVKAFTLGQIQVWLNAIFALSLLCWATGRKTASGVLVGLICLVKPHYGLFILWALLRREWSFIAACAVAIGAGLAASIAVFGWAHHVDYLRVVSFLSERGEAYYPNQSINGLLNRLMSIGAPDLYNNLEWREGHFPPFNPWVYGATLVSSLVILIAAMARRNREGDSDRVLDFCTMALSLTIASPIAWDHHYGITLPIFAVVLVGLIPRGGRLIWLAVSYVLISNFISTAALLSPGPWNVGQSYLLAGAFILLALLHGRMPAPRATTTVAVAGANGGQ